MRIPSQESLQDLLRWRAPAGVISIYLDMRPEDRGEPWRIELRNGLASVRQQAGSADGARNDLAATADRIQERFDALEHDHPSGRCQIGFVEVGAKPGREEWFAVQVPLREAEIAHDSRPQIGPLLAILDGGAPRCVAAVSAERVRLWRWSLGGLEEVDGWGLEIFSLDWRERKSQRSSDPARYQGTKASGRDQFDQRLEANRERFLHEAGRLAAEETRTLSCEELLAFGEAGHVRALAEGAGTELRIRHVEAQNLISEPLEGILERVGRHLVALQRERELELIDRVKQEVGRGERGALGAKATTRALEEGRVAHLVLDPRIVDESELIVEAALETSAAVTPVRGEAAVEALADSEGIAALLRY